MPRIHILIVFSLVIVLAAISCGGARLSSSDIRLYETLPDKRLAENALAHFIDSNFYKAIDTYAIILDRTNAGPSYRAWARYETGFCYYYMKDFKRAREHFEKVRRDFPQAEFASQRILAEMLIEKIDTGKTDGI